MRVRIEGRDHFINRLGRWDDAVARAKAQAISAQIWSDFQQGRLDQSLHRYKPLVEGQEPDLLAALKALMDEKRQGRVTHAYRVLKRYGAGLRTWQEVQTFLDWMADDGLAASTRATIVSTIRSVRPSNRALDAAAINAPHRQVMEEVLSIPQIQRVLAHLKEKEQWFYPVFALWLSTGLRNSELIGLTWDAVRFAEGELLIAKSLRRDGVSTHVRRWGTTKTGRSRVVPLNPEIVELLQQHRLRMGELGLDTHKGLVFVTPRSHGHLYDSGLEKAWKRAQRRLGLEPRRLYAQRHSFLSHALAMGNSPADLVAAAGHRTEQLLKTYAKPTGRITMPCWSLSE
ncbi:site-specific integrase [Prochlorococcus sp. MIT 1303]|uniref:site-specific integrase n=1 Tax=Prochlorococcus sp. MIT 1303 TaxID=1723647 RepID=UPI0007BB0207|nr:site-specific integrase [Prochlorococcus sp. MIT 1303]KZR70212.1 Tyrosine recombinase XerD [Prochlorococcus sp. MIT 1303]